MKYLLALGLWIALATGAAAQTWQSRTVDNGSLLFGRAFETGQTLSFACTAPSPDGRPLIETGSHESHLTEAFEMVVGISDLLIDWAPPYRLDTVAIYVGDQGFRLPVLELDELRGSAVYLPMTDPMVKALYDAPSLILDPGQGRAYEYQVDGLGAALASAMGYCAARWVEIGYPRPEGLVLAPR